MIAANIDMMPVFNEEYAMPNLGCNYGLLPGLPDSHSIRVKLLLLKSILQKCTLVDV